MPNFPAYGISQRQQGLQPSDLAGYGPGHWDALALSSFNLGESNEVLKWLSRAPDYNPVMPMPDSQYAIRYQDTGDGRPGVRFTNTRDTGLISLNTFDPSTPFTVYAVATAQGFNGGVDSVDTYAYLVNSVIIDFDTGNETNWNLGLSSISASNPVGRQVWSYIEDAINPDDPFNWRNFDVDFEANGRFVSYSSFNLTTLGLTGSYKTQELAPYSEYISATMSMVPTQITIGAYTSIEGIIRSGFVGDIHEIIIFQAEHDAETQARLYNEYLKPKWRISNTIV